MTTGCYETGFSLFANARSAGTLSTAKCPAPGTRRATNARGLPGGMLAAEIDSHKRVTANLWNKWLPLLTLVATLQKT